MDEKQLQEMLSNLDAPEPSKTAQNQAVNMAMAAFDKKTQGTASARRLTDIPNPFTIVRRLLMQKRYVLSGMAGAVSLVALVAVLGSAITQSGRGSGTIVYEQDLVSAKPSQRAREAAQTGGSSLPAPIGATKGSSLRVSEMGNKAKSDPLAQWRQMGEEKKRAVEAETNMPASAPTALSAAGFSNVKVAPVMSNMAVAVTDSLQPSYYQDEGRDKFEHAAENPVKQVLAEPVSTFSIDVDTASYTFARKMINQGILPQKDAVRAEEMINYFDYNYPLANSREQPFQPTVAVYDSPWREGNKVVHIGIKGYDVTPTEKPRSNLVFLIDVSGSMNSPDKLPLLKNSLKLLTDTLSPEDSVGIVVYAGAAGTVLEPTKASDKQKILDALERLQSGGSTAGAEGIRQAYALAESSFIKDGVNRVILATDGDFNVGITDQNELKSFIERKRDSGVFLSVLGFGAGNYNDSLMQTLAQNGNGNAAYIDTLNEARKVLVEEASSTLFTIAKDVKIQVEFNPQTVQEYRLVGYETRALKREDFNNDKIDAGEIGSGHTVTAIYEITPAGVRPMIDALRYAEKPVAAVEEKKETAGGNEYAFLKIRYKLPGEDASRLIERPVTATDEMKLEQLSDDVRFASAVAGFAQMLKGGAFTGSLTYDQIIETANNARGRDDFGYRAEFVNLVRLAKSAASMKSAPQPVPVPMPVIPMQR